MVHADLLRSIDEVSLMMETSKGWLINNHKKGTLPFTSIEIDGCYIFYIPTSMTKTLLEIRRLGVTKPLKFFKEMQKNKLTRLFDENTDWSAFDLEEYK